jgi:hypothetical protein
MILIYLQIVQRNVQMVQKYLQITQKKEDIFML